MFGPRLPGCLAGGGLLLGGGGLLELAPGLLLALFLGFFLVLFLVGPDDTRDRPPRDADVRPGRDLDEELVLADAHDVAVEAARGDDLVADLDVRDHLVQRRLPAPLRPDQQQPEEQEEDHDQDERAHGCNATARRPSASSLKAANSPRTIACRAWSASWSTKCRTYARLKRAHAGHSQRSSSGRGSRAKRAFRRLRRPSQVRALPVRAVRVGRTQSNMSIPRSTTSRTPSASPMPMK